MGTNKNSIAIILLVLSILISGCASKSYEPVSPENVLVTVAPLVIKEYQEQTILATVENNGT